MWLEKVLPRKEVNLIFPTEKVLREKEVKSVYN